MKQEKKTSIIILLVLAVMLACSAPAPKAPAATAPPAATVPPATEAADSPMTKVTDPPVSTEAPTVVPTVMPPTEAPSPTEIAHRLQPAGTLPGKAQVIHDQESDRLAGQKEAYGGDEFWNGRYERPFDREMNYIPEIDIQQANLFRDKGDEFIYAVIRLKADPAQRSEMASGFGVELDLELQGRGSILVWTERPLTTEWSVEGVKVWRDNNRSVGGMTPMKPDQPPGGDGYEIAVFDSGEGPDPDLAWSRISPENPMFIELAFKKNLLGETAVFLWGAWSALGTDVNSRFDAHDMITYEQAGSPMKSAGKNYPLKELAEIDNTCRAASGYTARGGEPGLCPAPVPPVIQEEPPNCVCTKFAIFASGSICVAWKCD